MCWPNKNPSQKMPVSPVATVIKRSRQMARTEASECWGVNLAGWGEAPPWQGLTDLNVVWLVAISTLLLPPFSQVFSCMSFMAFPQSSWVGFLSQSV